MFYPIELDKLTNQLEKTEKKIKEADHGIYVAKDEIQNLNRNIADKEIQLKINEQNFGPKSAALTKESAKYAFTFIYIYRTRAIIGRSWLEAALEYKPYIRPKVTVHKWSLEMG